MLEARGHEVVPFDDEREALARIKSDPFIEALITSAELKHMSGVELSWETRLIATCRRPIYVLMMSSQYDQRSLIEALDSGADDFIGKPPLAEELYARLRAAERLASMQRELIRLATTDPLTGLSRPQSSARAWRRPRATYRPSSSTSTISSRSTTRSDMRPATRRSAVAPALPS
ncbi:MAG TPA: response regulator [Methyloceanibacter sp.]